MGSAFHILGTESLNILALSFIMSQVSEMPLYSQRKAADKSQLKTLSDDNKIHIKK